MSDTPDFSKLSIDELIDLRQELKAQLDPIETQLDLINDALKPKLIATSEFDSDGNIRYPHGRWEAVLSVQHRESLSTAKLLQLGVLPRLIKDATVSTPSVRLDVRERKVE